MKPSDIRKLETGELMITWDDGHRSLYGYRNLRFQCQCAGCLDEMSGKRTITMDRVAAGVQPREIQNVGNYAVRFQWSDGHSTGIYPFELLRKLCECPVCSAARTSGAAS